jgi:hypothetical protein
MTMSVPFRTYLFLEGIYLSAGDESKEEKDALGIMDLVWNLLTSEERDVLDLRKNPGRKPRRHDEQRDQKGVEELEAAARSFGVKEGSQMSRFLLWIGNECFEGREVQNFMVLKARAKELVQMFLAQDRKEHLEADGIVGKSVGMKVGLSVSVAGGPQRCARCGEEDHGSANCPKLKGR